MSGEVLTSLVLASASPRRLELLATLGCRVDVCKSRYDEPDLEGVTPLQLAQRHAAAKAADVAQQRPSERIVVAADTVVDLNGHALNKPATRSDATRMLRSLSGRGHVVHTAVAMSVDGRCEQFTSSTRVRFYELSDDEIARYVATGEPMDKAGAYGIQGLAASLVEGIDGDFYTVMGFPLGRFVRAMRGLGFLFPAENNAA